ncbi:MAG TPA: AAA family ATPase, partial [Allocoleopsis sp.]
TVAGYQLFEKVYESPRSLVYRGYEQIGQTPVILKILRQDYPTAEAIAKFRAEYEITRRLNSSATIRAYALHKWQHSLVMVLEDFGGNSLHRLMQQHPFSIEAVLHLALQLVDALAALQQQHVIHKDINPSNIVLNPATQQLKLIDFGISTLLSQETPIIRSPHILEGTLPYLSPEQTGRLNRSIDYRTDFYSLGVTLYELLTHQRPFTSNDAIELVHCHLAKQAIPPHELKPEIPEPLSHLVMKLMEKMPEDRYQSTAGLKADLQYCLEQWQVSSKIIDFPLAQHDLATQLQIPQKLYGREQAIATLIAAFASRSSLAMMLISGYAGIGKSALVQELHKPITQHRGYFISGKFEQYQPHVPYAAIVSAFSDLVQQLLAEPEPQMQQWRHKLLTALGSNAQVIIEVIPEVELMIGKQPAVPRLNAIETQQRFTFVFQQFIQVLAKPDHPLVLFLDDLQWADIASLKLLQSLTTSAQQAALFLIGAYRNQEVDALHPLIQTIEVIKQSGIPVQQLMLSPLSLQDVNQLLTDTLHTAVVQTQPLAKLVFGKTGGNPFFINELLKTLELKNLLHLDLQQRCWTWDLNQIAANGLTNHVIELLTQRIQQLQPAAQVVLQLAACIGNRFDLHTLTIVCERSKPEMLAALHEAIEA